jgi:DNA invertase Pin-like site-specific DNA recombinase
MSKSFIAYIRVSTHKQGHTGVSLQEQQQSIIRYAKLHQLSITSWYEETETASKIGRSKFQTVVSSVKQGCGRYGLLMHKIDRGVRNLKDWATIGELMDQGVDVRFVHDNLDMRTRGGRLTADLQAVIAADFIRNLRDEVKKGIQGRLRQGLYPFKAPCGYLDQGRGKTKTPEPAVAPLVVAAFKLYASGAYSLRQLSAEMSVMGLNSLKGFPLRTTVLSKMLRNPFYVGDLVVNGQTYQGKHQPLISRELFDHVQKLLKQRCPNKRVKHRFQFSRRLRCVGCGKCLVGEKQKVHIYYRCGGCKGVCVREDRVSAKDTRFQLLFESRSANEPLLEPWEKFDSPWVGASSAN